MGTAINAGKKWTVKMEVYLKTLILAFGSCFSGIVLVTILVS